MATSAPISDTDDPGTDYAALLCRVADHRDRDSFITLFDFFAPRVKSFLMRGGFPEDSAEELAQETMLAVWHKAAQFDPAKAAASTWIFTIARNKRIDLLRKKTPMVVDVHRGSGQNNQNNDTDADPIAQLGVEEDNAVYLITAAQEAGLIADALQTLPDEQALLIREAFFGDKTHQALAEDLKIPLGTVKSRIRLGLERLRKELEDKVVR